MFVGIFLLLTASMIAGGIARVVGGTFSSWAIVVVGLTGGYAAGQAGGGIAAIVVSLLLVVLAKRTLLADRRDRFARRIVHRLVGRRGTRFIDADLTDADFSRTSLAQADLTGATLVGARLDTIKGWPPFVDRPPGSA